MISAAEAASIYNESCQQDYNKDIEYIERLIRSRASVSNQITIGFDSFNSTGNNLANILDELRFNGYIVNVYPESVTVSW